MTTLRILELPPPEQEYPGLDPTDFTLLYTYTGAFGSNSLSVGGTVNSNTIPENELNIMDNVLKDEIVAGQTVYRGIGFKNTGSFSVLKGFVWISGFHRSEGIADTISLALSTFPSNTMGICSGYNENNPPSETLTWVEEGTPSNSLEIGALSPGSWKGIWIRRVVPEGAFPFFGRYCYLSFYLNSDS